jgi:hypothetical protein
MMESKTVREKILSGDLKDRIEEGFMIIGPNSLDGELSTWHCGTEEEAVRMADSWCKSNGGYFEIIKYKFCGVVRPPSIPSEYATKIKTS